MAYMTITLKGDEYTLELDDYKALEILKKLGVLESNKQIEVYNKSKIKNNIKDNVYNSIDDTADNVIKDINKNSKKTKRLTVNDKIDNYGIERIKSEMESGKKDIDYFSNIFSVTTQSIKRNFKERDIPLKKITKKEFRLSELKLSNAGTILHKERKDLEKEIEITNGTCLRCGYRDMKSGHCGYSVLTLKDRRGRKGSCNHFIDLEDIL